MTVQQQQQQQQPQQWKPGRSSMIDALPSSIHYNNL